MANKLFNTFLKAVGVENEEYEEEQNYFDDSEEELAQEEEEASRNYRRSTERRMDDASRENAAQTDRSEKKGKVINHPMVDAKRHQTMIYQFTNYDETRPTIDDLLESRSVLINLDGLDDDVRQRVVDTFIGACYAINATIRKVAAYTYLLAPESVVVNGGYADDAAQAKGPADLNK